MCDMYILKSNPIVSSYIISSCVYCVSGKQGEKVILKEHIKTFIPTLNYGALKCILLILIAMQ